MLIAEDSLEDTVFPRLEAAGADLSRIHILKSTRLPKNLALVEEVIHQTHSRLLIIDPGLADLDRHCLCLLADLADRLRCAIVLQRYLNKWAAATRAICRGGGSMSVIGAARTAMLLARDPREDAIRILASTKNNYGPRPASLRFFLEPHPCPPPPVGGGEGGGTCRVHWLGTSPLGADDLLAIQSATEAKTAIAQAIKFLKEFLKDGPKATERCYAEARKNQIHERVLRNAKARLEIVCNQERDLLGLYIPATWELPNGKEDIPS
jgi:hypothetical protein